MALQYVGSVTGSAASSLFTLDLTALTGGVDTAARSGDIVILACGYIESAFTSVPGPSTTGYTQIAALYGNSTRDSNFGIHYKVMGGPADTSVTVAGAGTNLSGQVAIAHVWRGIDHTTRLDVAATTATGTTSGSPDSPSITPTTTGAIILSVGLGSSAATSSSTGLDFGVPTGMTNGVVTHITHSISPFETASIGIASAAWSSGAYDPAAWTGGSVSASDSWTAATIALRPMSGAIQQATKVVAFAVVDEFANRPEATKLVAYAVVDEFANRPEATKFLGYAIVYDPTTGAPNPFANAATRWMGCAHGFKGLSLS